MVNLIVPQIFLQLATHPGQPVPMPLIISHHAPGVPFPAHVMELTESTVIMAIERTTKTKVDADGEDIEEWNRHCFQIVNNSSSSSSTNEARMFTAPLQERNEWAFVINKELYSMEERLKKAREKEEVGQYTMAQREERKAKRLGMDGSRPGQRQTHPPAPQIIIHKKIPPPAAELINYLID